MLTKGATRRARTAWTPNFEQWLADKYTRCWRGKQDADVCGSCMYRYECKKLRRFFPVEAYLSDEEGP